MVTPWHCGCPHLAVPYLTLSRLLDPLSNPCGWPTPLHVLDHDLTGLDYLNLWYLPLPSCLSE